MYFPYFRGKQFELITIRESAPLMAANNFVPIIEPVKEQLSGLTRALAAVSEAGGRAIVIINPQYGDHVDENDGISALLDNSFAAANDIIAGIYLSDQITIPEIRAYLDQHSERPVALIHAGFSDARRLSNELGNSAANMVHVFLEDACGSLYRRHFPNGERVLLRDGFQRRINREHPPIEFFSELHVTYESLHMNGFGDFLTVGDDYSETGGPAYAVAIHLTFIDTDNDDAMFIHHFVSDRQDTPTDPAGKFAEALQKLINECNRNPTKIYETQAVQEFRDLYQREHFPGLGYVKKLSMKHHIETLSIFLDDPG